MPDENAIKLPEGMIDNLKAFLKSYDYGYHMLDGLAERHLSGEDIVSQIYTIHRNDMVKGIFDLIRCSDERAEAVLHSDLIDEDGRQKLSDIRSKYRPILEDILDVGMVIARGSINPISSADLSITYDQDEETFRVDIRGYSGHREVFRVEQDALQFLDFVVAIVKTYSDSLEKYQKAGVLLDKSRIKRLESAQKELQDSSAGLSKVAQKYLSGENQAGTTNE